MQATNISGSLKGLMGFHDTFKLWGIERVDYSLSHGDLELRLAIGKSRGNGRWVRKVAILTKGVDGSALCVLFDVVVCEFASSSKQ